MARITEAQDILRQLGLPKAQQNAISALTLLALCGIREEDPWTQAARRSLTIRKGIMEFINRNYRTYAENTRETFRRQVLHQFVQAGIVDHNPDSPGLPTNSSKSHYRLRPAVAELVKTYGSARWPQAIRAFLKKHRTLIELYDTPRKEHMVPVQLPNGTELVFSPGEHNELQARVITQFAPRFAPGARLLYVGDTARKSLLLDSSTLRQLGIPITEHDKLPDVVLYEPRRKWLFLVEVVTSHGPMSPKRVQELKSFLSRCNVGTIFVTAFADFKRFKAYANQIAWDTEVWLAELPDHLVHYNGDRFLGPR